MLKRDVLAIDIVFVDAMDHGNAKVDLRRIHVAMELLKKF